MRQHKTLEFVAPCNNSYHFWHWKFINAEDFKGRHPISGSSPSRGKCSATYKFFSLFSPYTNKHTEIGGVALYSQGNSFN